MIELNNLTGITDASTILNMLAPEADGSYEVYLPKCTELNISDDDDIALDYAQAAFAGQKLQAISTKFSYDYVPPEAYVSIRYVVEGVDKNALAKLLLELSYLYGVNETAKDYDYTPLDKFMDDIDTGKIIPACPDFVNISNEFFEADYEDEDEEEDEASQN